MEEAIIFEQAVKRMGMILAVQAEIEGMKAYNSIKIAESGVPDYNQVHFNELAKRLDDLAYAHRDQLG